MGDPADSFRITVDAAQRVVGVLAARDRGDHAGAASLLTDLDDHTRASGSMFLANLAMSLLAQAEGRDLQDTAAELSLHLAALAPMTAD